MKTRMRKREMRPLALFIPEGNQIKVQRARLIYHHLGLSAKLNLKCL